MNVRDTFGLVSRTLLARKGRSLLTMLGIVIGVSGVIVILALGAGAQSLILGQVTKLGSDLLSVQPGKSNEKGPPVQLFGIVVTTLTNADADALRRVPHIKAADAMVLGTATVTWGNQSIDTNFFGTDGYHPDVLTFTMREGTYFSVAQADAGANVAVLGSTVADELFGSRGVDPVGQVIKVRNAAQAQAGGVPLRVVGVINPRGNIAVVNMDDQVFLPLPIGQQQLLGIRHLQLIDLKVDAAAHVPQAIADVTRVMDERHHVRTQDQEDFTVRSQADIMNILSSITSALSLFLAAMAAISLVVGGVGILNIMLVTVAERTREIGLRKAVGATNGAIARQFLLEAAALTGAGGLVGVALGAAIALAAALVMHALGYEWAYVVSPFSVVLALVISVLTGVGFGLYPALKAARLDPIEALRYE